MRAIVGQQLSTKAAAAIYRRLADRFGGREPTPQEILADDPDELRSVGLSRAKVVYLRSLAEHVLNGSLELERLDTLPDEQVIAELTAVKGIGTWSAHMFLIFHLGRPDILAVGDLGIRKAMMEAYGLDALPLPAADGADRRVLAPAPHARLPLSLAFVGQRAGPAVSAGLSDGRAGRSARGGSAVRPRTAPVPAHARIPPWRRARSPRRRSRSARVA